MGSRQQAHFKVSCQECLGSNQVSRHVSNIWYGHGLSVNGARLLFLGWYGTI
jgi:ribosomal protein L37AE/L43A